MKRSTRWLIGFGSAILVLVVIAVSLVFILPGTANEDLPPENTPEGVVLRYFQAIGTEDYEQAFEYMIDSAEEKYPFIRSTTSWDEPDDVFDIGWKASVVETYYIEFQAHVRVEVQVFDPDSPFGNPVRTYEDKFILVEEDGAWKIQGPLGVPWYLY